MKAHIGVDCETGIVHSMTATAANVHDVTDAHNLLHGCETVVWGYAGYQGVHKREENLELDVDWRMAIFSELVDNAAEHRMTETGAQAHVRSIPHWRGHAFDAVTTDSGPGIRAALACDIQIPQPKADSAAIGVAVRELVSGTGMPTRGNGLWMVVTEMGKSGRKLLIHSSSGLLIMCGTAEPELRDIENRRGTLVRITIPA